MDVNVFEIALSTSANLKLQSPDSLALNLRVTDKWVSTKSVAEPTQLEFLNSGGK